MKKILPILITLLIIGCVANSPISDSGLNPADKKSARAYIQSLSRCPERVERGVFLDGGTVGVKVHYESSEIKYFGMENNEYFESHSSSRSLTNEEAAKIEIGKQVKLFLGIHPTAKTYSQILPFRGEEERELKATIQQWLTCEPLDRESKSQVNLFLSDIDSQRKREVKHLYDIPDRKLAEWREVNSRQGVFGKHINNEYEIIGGSRMSTTQLVDISACPESSECGMSWYRYEIKVFYKSKNHVKGDVINLVRKEENPTYTLISDVGAYVVSEIPNLELQKTLNAKYYLHEVSYPKKIICFNHLLSELGQPEWDKIDYQPYGEWERQCIPAD
ncbi:hypothetical protein FLL45_13300 [Aliikangiella marina]|uniref:Uncharacterized protein n=1 Tax=Aliikangiella marina TaxID=1712262 RepID=A0A545T9F7_9GAMM|nr:hypothetical protein [Aliikangiella marina]TQV73839.1 hypothetical protein FLL45_13300 [Aliikangiella marina]